MENMPKFYKDKMFWHWIILASLIGGIFGLWDKDFNVFGLMFTAVILIWYSVETRGARLISQEIKRLSIHPGLTLRYGDVKGGDWTIMLSNEGNGAALNPEIQALDHWRSLSFDLDGKNAIYPGHSISVFWIYNGRRNNQKILTQFDSKPLKVRITFVHALDLQSTLVTEEEFKNPPQSKITKTVWV